MSTAAVVGGGPAGLIAAEELARAGVRVTVYEHRPSVGRKLLLAGRGGLNLTHSEHGTAFLDRYGVSAERMRPLLDGFDPPALREWCAGLGEPTFVGSSGRVFPQSFRATPLLRSWLGRLAALGVTIETRRRWTGWVNAAGGGTAMRFESPDGSVTDVAADVAVFALGGASWPRVGSDGGWVRAFSELGVTVTPLRAANAGVRVVWSQRFADRFEGTPLKYVGLSLTTWNAPAVRGDAMVTRTGLEGGPVYALGSAIRDAVDTDGRCGLAIDLHPDLTVTALADRLSRRRPKESTSTWLRRAIGLAPVSIGLLHETRQASAGDLPVDPGALAALVKAVPVLVSAVMPIDRAISTAGGVAWSEVDDTLMLRRLPGTFVAGEMLDWEAPTGGYLLQGSFSTGVAAARGALAWLDR